MIFSRKAKIGTKEKPDTVWNDDAPRSLREAARIAHAQAIRESLPIVAAPAASRDQWYCQSLLRQGAVHGTHAAAREPKALSETARSLRLSPDASFLYGQTDHGPVWRALYVEKTDFALFLAWLRTFW